MTLSKPSLTFIGASAAMLLAIASIAAPLAAPVRPVTDNYFGTEVIDNYRYMENLKDSEVQAWMKSQADHTRAELDRLPGRAALLKRIHELANTDPSRSDFVRRGQRYFYLALEPGSQLRKLVYRDGLSGSEHLLVDPEALGAGSATHFALDFFVPSWDGRYVAYGLSKGGSEASVLHVIEVADGKDLGVAIDRTSDGVIAWRPDNRSFFYLRYAKLTPETPPAESEYNARTYLHVLGGHPDGEGDAVVFGRGVSKQVDVPEGQGTYIVLSPDSRYAVAVANHNMDNNPSTLFVAPLSKVTGANTPWKRLAEVGDGITRFELHGERVIFLSQKNATRYRLLSTSLARPDVHRAEVVAAENAAVKTDFALAREGIYLRERVGAVSRLRFLDFAGTHAEVVGLPFQGNVSDMAADPRESGVLFCMENWSTPEQAYRFDPSARSVSNTGLIPPSRLDASWLESKETAATSYDGTRVPLSIVSRRGLTPDGSRPTILMGYGAYGNSRDPMFAPKLLAWLERGGVIAVAHIRGGGEMGEDWHRGGMMLTKTNTILDFIACAQYLIDEKYTSPRRLAAWGGSAGGITVGGAMTWRPDLFAVVLDFVGMSDALRYETEPNGPPNVSEFGSTKTETGFHGLYAMSAYTHVRDGTAYPAVIFSTGANDPRVAPWQMAKMAARVQAATASGKPVLLRVDYDAGHGIGSAASQREMETADTWSFALWQMGDPEFQPTAVH